MAVPFFGPTEEASRSNLFDLIGYRVMQPVVADFHKSRAPHRIISAPARTSKSYSAAPEIVHDFFPSFLERDGEIARDEQGRPIAEHSETICWIVATDYKTAKEWDYAWNVLLDKKLIESFGGVIEASFNSPNSGNMAIRVVWPWMASTDGNAVRSILETKSATNERSLQGEEIRTCILSEAAEHDERIVRKYLLTRCGKIIYPTTPKRKAMWLHEMIVSGQEDPELGIDHFQYDGHCNPTYDWERFRRAEKKAALNYGKPEEDPEFAEQFLGLWTFEGGKVFPFRWLEDGSPSNVIHKLPHWISTATWFVSLDYGFDDPAVAIFWAVDPAGDVMGVSEIYETHLTPGDFVRRIVDRMEEMRIVPDHIVPDPQHPVCTEILRRHGLNVFDLMRPADLRARDAGYQELRDALALDPATNRPRMSFYAAGCPRTINEFKKIRFKEGHSNEFSEAAIVGEDHGIDASRHFIRSRLKAKADNRDWVREFLADRKRQEREKTRLMRSRPPTLVGHNPQAWGAA